MAEVLGCVTNLVAKIREKLIAEPGHHLGDISYGMNTYHQSFDELFKGRYETNFNICGMGGSRKTVMVKEVARRVEAEKMFDEIIMAVVSKEHDPMTVQEDLAK
ncbi:disease resistance protein-like protein [Tanacetum coccineum]